MNEQSLFDFVVNFLRQQGEPSVDPASPSEYPRCRYRQTKPDGRVLKCAVGCLIPDELYDGNMENCVVYSPSVKEALLDYARNSLDLLSELQRAHDLSPFDPCWLEGLEQRFVGIARIFSLVYTPPSCETKT